MRPPARWPLHPAPLEGEALSSWLRRIAAGYHMYVWELLEHDLGHAEVTEYDLDVAPPPTLLAILAQRSGVDPNRLHQMSLAGWTPWLLDSVQPERGTFDTYVHQFSVLLKPGKRSKRSARTTWLPWVPDNPIQRACPHCLDDPARQGLLLMWQLPLLLSCPDHACMLEPCTGFPGDYLAWTGAENPPHTASEEVMAMDHRTQQALRTGRVELPCRSVHAGIWFRLLRTIIDELSAPVTYWGARAPDLRTAWASCGHPVRAGQGNWRPFETLPWPIQAPHLEAAAATIHRLETGTVTGRGAHAALFLPTPYQEVDPGRVPPREKPGPWELAIAALEGAVQAARQRPAEAQNLYNLAVFGCRTPESVQRLRAEFIALGIPTESMSYNHGPAPLP